MIDLRLKTGLASCKSELHLSVLSLVGSIDRLVHEYAYMAMFQRIDVGCGAEATS